MSHKKPVKSKVKILRKRQWLNKKENTTAYIRILFESSNKGQIYGDIEIKDCNRQISLEFDVSNGKKQHAIHKMNVIRQMLDKAEKFINENS